MAKPLNEFGGWLKFFYITLWIRLILYSYVCLMHLLCLLGGSAGNEA